MKPMTLDKFAQGISTELSITLKAIFPGIQWKISQNLQNGQFSALSKPYNATLCRQHLALIKQYSSLTAAASTQGGGRQKTLNLANFTLKDLETLKENIEKKSKLPNHKQINIPIQKSDQQVENEVPGSPTLSIPALIIDSEKKVQDPITLMTESIDSKDEVEDLMTLTSEPRNAISNEGSTSSLSSGDSAFETDTELQFHIEIPADQTSNPPNLDENTTFSDNNQTRITDTSLTGTDEVIQSTFQIEQNSAPSSHQETTTSTTNSETSSINRLNSSPTATSTDAPETDDWELLDENSEQDEQKKNKSEENQEEQEDARGLFLKPTFHRNHFSSSGSALFKQRRYSEDRQPVIQASNQLQNNPITRSQSCPNLR